MLTSKVSSADEYVNNGRARPAAVSILAENGPAVEARSHAATGGVWRDGGPYGLIVGFTPRRQIHTSVPQARNSSGGSSGIARDDLSR